MTMPVSAGGGLGLKLIEAGTSSGSAGASQRIMLDSPLSRFGVCVELVSSSSQAGLTAVELYGAASQSTSITDAQAIALVTWSTNSGNTVWNSTGGAAQPVSQIWAQITDAATSAAARVDVWIAAVP